eukprot:6146408-Pyramimonas_sp.AAC.1
MFACPRILAARALAPAPQLAAMVARAPLGRSWGDLGGLLSPFGSSESRKRRKCHNRSKT